MALLEAIEGYRTYLSNAICSVSTQMGAWVHDDLGEKRAVESKETKP